MIDFFKSNSLQSSIESLLDEASLDQNEKDWLSKLPRRIHKNESGYLTDGGLHYLKVGLSAMSCIQTAIQASQANPPHSILDFPCGYGRVMRFLKVAYPKACLEGADLDKKAIRFCRRYLDARTSLSQNDFDTLNLGNSFDLIWCGSLVTHLNKERIGSLLRFFHRHLNPGGVCVFTSHGIRVEQLLDQGEINYSLTPDRVQKVLDGYRETGAGFSEYNQSREGYGISLTSDVVVRQLANNAGDWTCTSFEPAGWDNHHDVYAFCKQKL